MRKILTILNRAAWLIALISISVIFVILRTHFRSIAEISSLRETVASGQKSIDAAAKRESARDTALQQKMREIEALKRKVQTPAQVVAALPAELAELPLPIGVSRSLSLGGERNIETNDSVPSSTARGLVSSSSNGKSEESGAVLSIPDPDLKPLFDHLEDCRETTAAMETLKMDLTDTREQLSEMATERDTAIRNTSANTRWGSFKRAAKWLAVGATVGMALSHKL